VPQEERAELGLEALRDFLKATQAR